VSDNIGKVAESLAKLAEETDAGVAQVVLQDDNNKPFLAIVIIRDNIDGYLSALNEEQTRLELEGKDA
jgi:hypothetical protein